MSHGVVVEKPIEESVRHDLALNQLFDTLAKLASDISGKISLASSAAAGNPAKTLQCVQRTMVDGVRRLFNRNK